MQHSLDELVLGLVLMMAAPLIQIPVEFDAYSKDRSLCERLD
jgi:Zn-dependent membrane protease YugP